MWATRGPFPQDFNEYATCPKKESERSNLSLNCQQSKIKTKGKRHRMNTERNVFMLLISFNFNKSHYQSNAHATAAFVS